MRRSRLPMKWAHSQSPKLVDGRDGAQGVRAGQEATPSQRSASLAEGSNRRAVTAPKIIPAMCAM